MKLSRVVITGFKTFARRSEVILDQRITALVGPNGSGKSNFVDAIRWALGETNARELRGARMDEVIHAGPGPRGRLGLAEVELVIDNESGRLPVEGAEVAVARRVVRDGDSEFRLNGDRVRLRDLERVLGPTGLTQAGYAVVAQHDIDDIIQATPARRRSLVEQAAGVRPLRAACDDATGRMDRAEATLRRLDDFLSEAEPRLAELVEQARVAREQRDMTSRLAELRGSLAREEWRAARARLKQARRRLDAADSRVDAATEAESGFVERMEAERASVAGAREQQASATARMERSRLAAERASGELRRWADRRDIGALHRAQAAAEAAVALAELEPVRLLLVELEETGEPEDADERAPALLQLAQARAARAVAAERLAAAESERSAAEARLASATAERTAAVSAQREAASRRAVAGESLAALEREVAEVRARIEATLHGELGSDAAVAGAIARGEVEGVRLSATYSVVDPADSIAVEAALEAHLDAWLLEDGDAALQLLDGQDQLREQVVLAGLPASGAPGWAPDGARPALAALRIVDEAARGALESCLANTWLVADSGAARSVADRTGGAAVCPDGTVVTPASIRGGAPPHRERRLAAEPDSRRLAALEEARRVRRDELAAAGTAIDRGEHQRTAAEAAFLAARDALSELAVALDHRRQEMSEGERALRNAETEAARAGLEADDRRRRLKAARADEAGLVGRCREAELRLLSAECDVVAAVARAGAARAQAAAVAAEVDESAAARAAVAPVLAEVERRLAALDAERAEVAVARARAEDERDAAVDEVAAAERAVAELAEAVREDDADAGPEPDAQAAERAEREIVRLERRIAQLGPVNAFAPEQERELDRRVTTVRANRDDLATACADLRSLAQRLGDEGERRFESVFGAVSSEVHRLFGELFPGGTATLRLERPVDGNEPALPGVEILAQPPGKGLQPLSLLSGGERALTSLAVILGLQQVNPSPFYVFDEVDAALDDSNVTRFTRLLARLADRQQFVVVSHNHITMAAADALYGVTIDREGISSIISVRLDRRAGEESGRIVAIPSPPVEAVV